MSNRNLAILGSRGIPAHYGGFETFAEQLATRLAKQGIDVTVFCERDKGQSGPGQYCGVNLIYVSAPDFGPLTTIIFDIRCLWRARRNYDVVYMLGYGASLFCCIPRFWRREVWINMDGVEWARTKWNWLAKLWFRIMEYAALWTASLVVADSRGIDAHLKSRHRRRPNTAIIAYGAEIVSSSPDCSVLQEWGLSPGAYYLVVCRLESENQIREIVEGYSLSKSERPLIIVGDHGSDTPYVTKLLQFRDARVRYVGTVFDKSRLQALRWNCRAYFHGHCVGGTNPSLLEALGCGNQIAAHDNVYNREVAGDCALYFRSLSDVTSIVEEFDRSELTNAKRAARWNRIRENYTWDKVVHAYCEMLTVGR